MRPKISFGTAKTYTKKTDFRHEPERSRPRTWPFGETAKSRHQKKPKSGFRSGNAECAKTGTRREPRSQMGQV